ncbi:MAG: GNAT family N-acetyltransferase [Acidimicrobiia bacterium]|nr:GNAT family N-acetyltransferase [Acidimicrobiia bacterium]
MTMPAGRAELIAVEGSRLRIGPWHGSSTVGQVALIGDELPLSSGAVRGAVARLVDLGYQSVNTGAVPELATAPFLDAGFTVHERLHLLAHRLREVERPPRGATRRAKRSDRRAVLAVDHAAFEPFWRLDEVALEESLQATPVSRFRVTEHDGVSGYAVFGWAADRGYLQRLAVRPDTWGHGLGELLVRDGLWWLQRKGASSALVNTQESNERGLRLYQRLGFVLEPHGLVVLEADLTRSGATAPRWERARGGEET